jgi:hypothetical protein
MEFRYIDQNGIALDDNGHEFRDENGQIIIVPPSERGFYDIAYNPDNLISYCVSLHEDKGDKFTLFFDCMAEDQDHAEEQALNAYPNGEIINCTEHEATI